MRGVDSVFVSSDRIRGCDGLEADLGKVHPGGLTSVGEPDADPGVPPFDDERRTRSRGGLDTGGMGGRLHASTSANRVSQGGDSFRKFMGIDCSPRGVAPAAVRRGRGSADRASPPVPAQGGFGIATGRGNLVHGGRRRPTEPRSSLGKVVKEEAPHVGSRGASGGKGVQARRGVSSGPDRVSPRG